MKSSKMNGLHRSVAFILIAILLICVIAFAANGWQSNTNDDPDSGNVGNKTDETDENTDGTNDSNGNQTPDDQPPPNEPEQPDVPDEPTVEVPKYYNKFTGLEITEQQLYATPTGFVLNPKMPLYGISSADITFEFPTENGATRLLTYFTNSSTLWKVGSIAPTRDFITATSNLLGGIVVGYGSDDIVEYSASDTSRIELDLSKISGSYYVENTRYIYTCKDMIDLAISRTPGLIKSPYKEAPYIFAELGTSVLGTAKATTVILPFSETDETEFYYSESTGQYLYFKSGTRKVDMLNGKNVAYTNVFTLFADTTTYEKADGTELIVDTMSGGSGYYFSNGYMTEIRWSVDEGGNLEFKTLSGELLTVNRGNAYIGYYKAANASKITIG